MPNKYTYSVRAARDVKSIYKSTVKDWGTTQADKYDAGLERVLQLVADTPNLGRLYQRLQKKYYRHEHESHVIFYRQRKTDVFIIRILHKKMLPEKHL